MTGLGSFESLGMMGLGFFQSLGMTGLGSFQLLGMTGLGFFQALGMTVAEVFLQRPITGPTDGHQVLRFPIGLITVQMTDGQNLAAHLGTLGLAAMLAAMPGADSGKFGHFLTLIQPFCLAVSGLEVTVYFLLGGQPLHADFPSLEPARADIP